VVVFGERHLRHLLNSYQRYLQRGSHAPVAAERRAYPACRPKRRPRNSSATFGRTTPPICSRL